MLNPEAIMDSVYLRIITSTIWGGMPKLEMFQYQCLQRYNIIGIRETWWDETMPGEHTGWLQAFQARQGGGMCN